MYVGTRTQPVEPLCRTSVFEKERVCSYENGCSEKGELDDDSATHFERSWHREERCRLRSTRAAKSAMTTRQKVSPRSSSTMGAFGAHSGLVVNLVGAIENQRTRKSSRLTKDSKSPRNEKDEGEDLERVNVGKAHACT